MIAGEISQVKAGKVFKLDCLIELRVFGVSKEENIEASFCSSATISAEGSIMPGIMDHANQNTAQTTFVKRA